MGEGLFFILGAPRSGTTMLQMALNRHSRVVIPPETHYFSLPYRSRRGQALHWRRIRNELGIDFSPPRLVRPDSSACEPYLRLMGSYVARRGGRAVSLIGEKSNDHTWRVNLIRRCFPQAKYIVINRDGRDVALSLTKVPWMPDDLELCFFLWLAYQRAQERAVAEHSGHMYCLKYEELVADPSVQLRGVTNFLGLDDEPAVAAGSGNRDGIPDSEMAYKGRALKPITAELSGRWHREMSPDQVAKLERLGGTTLVSLGYALKTDTRRLPSPRQLACLVMRGAAFAAAKKAGRWSDEWFGTHFDFENKRLVGAT